MRMHIVFLALVSIHSQSQCMKFRITVDPFKHNYSISSKHLNGIPFSLQSLALVSIAKQGYSKAIGKKNRETILLDEIQGYIHTIGNFLLRLNDKAYAEGQEPQSATELSQDMVRSGLCIESILLLTPKDRLKEIVTKQLIPLALKHARLEAIRFFIEHHCFRVNYYEESNNAIIYSKNPLFTLCKCIKPIPPIEKDCYPIRKEKALELLLEQGFDVNSRETFKTKFYPYLNVKNSTPLHVASYYLEANLIKALIEKKADVNALDDDKQNCLHYLCRYHANAKETIELVQHLIKHGINVTQKSQPFNDLGQKPLEILQPSFGHRESDQTRKQLILIIENAMAQKAIDK